MSGQIHAADMREVAIAQLERDLKTMRRKFKELEHLAWHVCESSEENASTGEITVDLEDLDALSAALSEEHPDPLCTMPGKKGKDE